MTPHPADFFDAHRRHWEDAEILFGRDRWANADQLYGLSAEFGLKVAMMTLGMRIDTAGRPEPKYRWHVQKLWPIFETFARGRNEARYLALLLGGRPFADWSHHNR